MNNAHRFPLASCRTVASNLFCFHTDSNSNFQKNSCNEKWLRMTQNMRIANYYHNNNSEGLIKYLSLALFYQTIDVPVRQNLLNAFRKKNYITIFIYLC